MNYIMKSKSAMMSIGITFIVAIIAILLFISYKKNKTNKFKVLSIIAILASIGLSINAYNVTKYEIAYIKFIEMKQKYYQDYEKQLEIPDVVEYGAKISVTFGDDFDDVLPLKTDELKVHKYQHEVIDEDGYTHVFEFETEVVDTTPPVIKGEFEYNVPIEDNFDKSKIKVSATDNVDGKVDVKIEGELDGKSEGTYKLKAIAIDSSGNKAEKNIKVTVYDQPVQSIKFHKGGRTVMYYNKGSSGGQRQIDSQPATATTWNMYSYTYTHSNTDGRPTYFAGHYYNAFIPVTTMQVGDKVTVRDHTGHKQIYQATSRYLIGVSQVNGVTYGNQAAYAKIQAFNGEGIVFQTCVANDPSVMILVELRPVN